MTPELAYEVNLNWKEGRIGELSSPILNEPITCATPPDFPNGVAGLWSPEHLFAASINSCFMATFLAIAYNSKLEIENFSCKTVVTLEMVDGRYLITKATISPTVKLQQAEADSERAMRVLEKTKAGCLVTNSIKTAITMESTIV